MKDISIKTIKNTILNNVYNQLTINESVILNGDTLSEAIVLFKKHPILIAENNIIDLIINSNHKNESVSVEFIKSLIEESFKNYNSGDYLNAHNMLNEKYGNITETDNTIIEIQKLIRNHFIKDLNVTEKHEIFDNILSNKKTKVQINENDEVIDEQILNIAFKLHENTISEMNDIEKKIYNTVIENGEESAFNFIKESTLQKLELIKNDETVENVNQTKKKINEMVYTSIKDIDKLNDLYKKL